MAQNARITTMQTYDSHTVLSSKPTRPRGSSGWHPPRYKTLRPLLLILTAAILTHPARTVTDQCSGKGISHWAPGLSAALPCLKDTDGFVDDGLPYGDVPVSCDMSEDYIYLQLDNVPISTLLIWSGFRNAEGPPDSTFPNL